MDGVGGAGRGAVGLVMRWWMMGQVAGGWDGSENGMEVRILREGGSAEVGVRLNEMQSASEEGDRRRREGGPVGKWKMKMVV